MSLFDDMYASSAAPLMLEIMGDSVTYEDDATDPVTLTAIQSPIAITEEDVDHGQDRRYRTSITITTDPTGDYKGVANPMIGARVTISGVVWTVDDIEPKSASLVVLHLLRVGSIERTRTGLRKG